MHQRRTSKHPADGFASREPIVQLSTPYSVISQKIKLNCSSKQFSEKEMRGIKNLHFTYLKGS